MSHKLILIKRILTTILFIVMFAITFNLGSAQTPVPEDVMVSQAISLSPDGTTLAVFVGALTCMDSEDFFETRLIDVETNVVIRSLRGHTCPAAPVWSPDGSKLITVGSDLSRIWDASTGSEIAWLNSNTGLRSVSWKADGTRLASAESAFVLIFDPTNGIYLQNEMIHTSTGITASVWHPSDSNTIATGFADGTIQIWDTSGQLLNTFTMGAGPVYGLRWSPSGNLLLSNSGLSSASVLDPSTGMVTREFDWPDDTLLGAKWSQDGELITAVGLNGQVRIWDFPTGELVELINDPSLRINDIALRTLGNGEYEALYVGTPRDLSSDVGIQTQTVMVTPAQSVTSFTLVNADTDQDIRTLSNNDSIDLATDGSNLNIRADTDPSTVGSVVFQLTHPDSSVTTRTDDSAPYKLFDESADWTPEIGSYTLTATPYSEANGGGTAGTLLTVSFTVADSDDITSQVQPLTVCWVENPNGNTSAWEISNPNPVPLQSGPEIKVLYDWSVSDSNGVIQSGNRADTGGTVRFNTPLAERFDVSWYLMESGQTGDIIGQASAHAIEANRCES